jgi:hypothetical protein
VAESGEPVNIPDAYKVSAREQYCWNDLGVGGGRSATQLPLCLLRGPLMLSFYPELTAQAGTVQLMQSKIWKEFVWVHTRNLLKTCLET